MAKFVLSAFADEIDPDLDTQMDVLEQHSIRHIEMRGVNGRNILEYSVDEIREIKKSLDARGFRLSAVGSPIGKIGVRDDFSPHMEKFRHALEAARILESPYIRMFSFYIPDGLDPGDFRDEVIKRWRKFVEEARGSGIGLLHENEKKIYGDTPGRCLDLVKTLDCKEVKLVFDPANFIQCGEVTYPDAFELLKDYVVYMHIKDARHSDRRVVPAGEGDGKIREILAELYRADREIFLALEPHLGKFTGFAALEPGTPGYDLEDGGPKKFAVAAQALKKILGEVAG